MATHDLKLDARWFDAVASGHKTVELRREDTRQFAVGDVLLLREWETVYPDSDSALAWYSASRYTGRTCRVRVTHILRHDDVPDLLPPGVAALSIRLDDGASLRAGEETRA
jgi:ASC-1-like (ASCH) protein